jgi:XTP/dITP diphosphohydrolase
MKPATHVRPVVYIATSNSGKLRDFAAVAAEHGIEIAGLPNFKAILPAREDAPTFEANACKKAEHYSRCLQDELVLADDSGLRVDALGGAPGVHSARYAAQENDAPEHENSDDDANNERLLRELVDVPDERRTAQFVCKIAAARNGRLLTLFHGEVNGTILHSRQGHGGFGYDPLFYVWHLGKTFAELTPTEKSEISHRGQAFRKFLRWYQGEKECAEVVWPKSADSDDFPKAAHVRLPD